MSNPALPPVSLRSSLSHAMFSVRWASLSMILADTTSLAHSRRTASLTFVISAISTDITRRRLSAARIQLFQTTSIQLTPLASRLINAQPLPAHRPAADDNSLIGCTRPRPDRWLVAAYSYFIDSLCPFRCSFGCVLSLNQMFWKQCTIWQYQSDLFDQSALEIRVWI